MALCGGVAQLVARLHGMQEVRGSNPLVSTTYRVSGRFRYMGHWPSSSVYARTTSPHRMWRPAPAGRAAHRMRHALQGDRRDDSHPH